MLADIPGGPGLLRFANTPAQGAFIAFVQAMLAADPGAPTRCAGWTVHELTAHLAAGSAEIADLVALELSGAASRPTRDFEEREAPYRALAPKQLHRKFFEEALTATVAVERLRQCKGRSVAFTGALLDARALTLHIESELILHRWDIVGSDETSIRALSDARIGVHAATTVAAMQPNVFPPRGGECASVILRSVGASDITVTGGPVTIIGLGSADHLHPVVECHPAARTLLIWGRCPGPDLPTPDGDPEMVDAVITMLRPNPHPLTRREPQEC
ncbi:maleylpyruvate isomerase N-terminal domain-containing protein [Mycobacterium sp. 050272]|uniref:maleylpyruvate isomerase N-terminal domain-containing protein n=1 Tax=Mycobacterium sp. 050272 TaxID=3142488 RepID=UPI00318BAC81